MQVIISKNGKFIHLCVVCDENLGWEEIQEVKDKLYPNTAFIEVFPKRKDIVNKAKERHLFHVFDSNIPNLEMIETEMMTEFHEIKPSFDAREN